MKKIIGILLSAVLILSMSASVFAESEKETAAQELEKYGIVKRNHLGALTVEGPVTRAEMAKMLVLMLGLTPDSKAHEFTDVPADHWANVYIGRAVAFGIVNGMGDGTFAPDEQVTYQQAVKMVVCALGYGVDAERRGGYPHGYVMTAMDLGLAPSPAVMTENADRGQVMIMLAKALDIPIMVAQEDEHKTIYKVLNGKDGESFVTLRTRME